MASQYVKLPASGGGGGGGAVDSFNGRTGVVVSQSGDYSASLITNTPAGTISSTNVQSAVNELDSDVVALTSTVSALTTTVAGKQPLDADLTAIAAISSNGLIARTGSGTAEARTITAGTNISVSNGDGVSGNPSIAFSGTLPIANGGTGITTVPTIGKLLIGNGTGYVSANLSAGSGIAITNGAGSISISNSATAAFINIDGGVASTLYGGTGAIDGGPA